MKICPLFEFRVAQLSLGIQKINGIHAKSEERVKLLQLFAEIGEIKLQNVAE